MAQNSGLTNLTSRRVPSSHTTSTGWTRRDLNCRRRQLIIGRGDTEAEARRDHDKKLDRLLQRAREQSLKVNNAKMRLHMAEINNIGHVVTPEGVKMDPEKIADNKKIPTPTDIERVRRFLRFTHNHIKFMPNLAAGTERFCNHRPATCLLCIYLTNVTKPMIVQCDGNTQGLGAAVIQEGEPVAYVSLVDEMPATLCTDRNGVSSDCFCTPKTQPVHVRVFRCHSPQRPYYTPSGHLPKSLLGAPKRLQRMMLALQRYNPRVVYKPGTGQLLADVSSRAPSSHPPVQEMSTDQIFQSAIQDDLAEEIDPVDSQIYFNIREPRIAQIRQASGC